MNKAIEKQFKCGLWGCGRKGKTPVTILLPDRVEKNIVVCGYHLIMMQSADKEPRE